MFLWKFYDPPVVYDERPMTGPPDQLHYTQSGMLGF